MTLTNLHNNQSVTADELELYRQGTVKLLNSLSRSPDILGMDKAPASRRVIAVDEARTIFRFDLRDIGWDHEDWSRVSAHYPYGQKSRDGLRKVISSATPSQLPHMRADWFVFATSQPPLYHDLLKIEPTLQALEDRLHVDRAKNIRDGRVARAGFGESGQFQIFANGTVVWDRKTDGGFPEAKVLKQKVRDVVDPERDLGHSDQK